MLVHVQLFIELLRTLMEYCFGHLYKFYSYIELWILYQHVYGCNIYLFTAGSSCVSVLCGCHSELYCSHVFIVIGKQSSLTPHPFVIWQPMKMSSHFPCRWMDTTLREQIYFMLCSKTHLLKSKLDTTIFEGNYSVS